MSTVTTNTSMKATSAPIYNSPPWNDLRTPLLSASTSGSNPPTISRFASNGGSQGVFTYLFPSDSVEREVYFSVQLPHSYLEGSTLNPHLHFSITSGATGTTQWGLEYTISPIGGVFNATTTIITGSLTISPAVPYQHYILRFPSIPGIGLTISSVALCRLFRYPSSGTSPVDSLNQGIYAFELDFHIMNDTAGSRIEYTK